jgi:hypothetical protein
MLNVTVAMAVTVLRFDLCYEDCLDARGSGDGWCCEVSAAVEEA